MNIACANFETSAALNEASRDQVLIAVSASCQLVSHHSTLNMPDLAILWFMDNLLSSCVKVARKESIQETFRDFYGEYEVTIRPAGIASVLVAVETGEESFSATAAYQELHDAAYTTLDSAESTIPGLAECLAFGEIRKQMLGLTLELISTAPTPDSPP